MDFFSLSFSNKSPSALLFLHDILTSPSSLFFTSHSAVFPVYLVPRAIL